VITVMVILCSLVVSKIYFRSIYVGQLEQKIQTMEPNVKKIEEIMTEVRSVKEYLSNQGRIINVLGELYDIIPQNTYFSDIRVLDTGDFSIKGFSDSMSSIFIFIGIMEESKYFKDVVAKYTSKRKEDDVDIAIFEVGGKIVSGK